LYRLDVLEAGATTAANTFSMARITGSDSVANDLTLIGPNTSQVRIKFGDPEDATIGEIGYNHSNNSLRLNTNGATRLTIDSEGKVGIGTASPSYKLHISEASTTGGVNLLNISTTGTQVSGNFADLSFRLGNIVGRAAVIRAITNGSSSGNGHDLAFLTSQGGQSPAERMRITATGNVGIGTASPLTKFDCQTSNTGTVLVTAAFRDSSTNGNALQIWNGNNESRFRAIYYGNASNQSITFWTSRDNGTEGERMRINHIGNILFKGQSTTTFAESIFQNLDFRLAFFASNTTSFSKDISFFTSGVTAEERLRISSNGNILMSAFSSGNVGIGTSNPTPHNGSNALIIQGGSGSRGIMEIWDNSGTGGKAVFQQVGGDTYIGSLAKGTGSGDLYLLTTTASPNISMLLKGNGNVLIGTTTDTSDKLRVAGNTFTDTITTLRPDTESKSVAWRLGVVSSGTTTPDRLIRVMVGDIEYNIPAREA
jgi:hypothetical protein